MMETSLKMLLKKGFAKSMTTEERSFYMRNFMTNEERMIGKPIFEMTSEEGKRFNCLCANQEEGDLDGYNCPLCKNKGEILTLFNGYLSCKRCSCMDIRQSLLNMKKSGLCGLLETKTFESYQITEPWQSEIVSRAKKFVDSNSSCFLLCGQSGIGKTHICTAISAHLLKKGMPLKYMKWIDESRQIKQSVKDQDKYFELMNELKTVQVLYIDDFFKTSKRTTPSDADISLAVEIINERYNRSQTSKRRYVTIISTELTVKQLNDMDNALTGRLCEMAGKEYITHIFGEDKNFRLKKALGG